jgi:predicted DNA-binding transcriptional regulator YafY
MNRLDRVTAILIQLQSKRVVKAQEIADRFNISLRTVYRDIKTLDEAGIPISGEAGVGYSIMDGYRLPPVMFTKEEATAFLTAEKLVEKLTDPSTREGYKTAMFKVKAVLRFSEKDYLEGLQDHIEVVENPYLPRDTNHIHLQPILKSIAEKTLLDIGYTANHDQQYTNREVEPVGIFYQGHHWYMIAYCRLRNDYRHFRADRISYINETDRTFKKEHPALQSFLTRIGKEKELHTVIIRVDKDVLKYFGEQKYYNGFVSQKDTGHQMEMTFLTASLNGFVKFFLLFGESADIISPVNLRDMIQLNMQQIAERCNTNIAQK